MVSSHASPAKENEFMGEDWKNVYGGGAVTSWLVRSTSDRVVQVRALAGDIVLCSWTLYSHSASLHPGV